MRKLVLLACLFLSLTAFVNQPLIVVTALTASVEARQVTLHVEGIYPLPESCYLGTAEIEQLYLHRHIYVTVRQSTRMKTGCMGSVPVTYQDDILIDHFLQPGRYVIDVNNMSLIVIVHP